MAEILSVDRFDAVAESVERELRERVPVLEFMATAGPDFFHRRKRVVGLLEQAFAWQGRPLLNVRILLLDPGSEVAKRRADFETPHPTIQDIKESLEQLELLHSRNMGLTVKLYSFHAPGF